MFRSIKRYRRVFFILLLANFIFVNSYPVYTTLMDFDCDQIEAYLDKEKETEKDSSEDDKKESSEYYIHHLDEIYQEKIKQQLIVLHFENFENLLFPPFSPPPENC